ncbi:F-box/WD-40 repeat-containing protein At3g52030 [Nymphaea colorata]|uniref:F-box/WD-40 repeat-containing protein At3g52030 n=1 Tax=Nymphaea colorata TaxID=210225 RepID=UPI00129EEDAF|nr:F-box/WD-40 repeat-containing protein At3g52030 [Nymphaea colorata]
MEARPSCSARQKAKFGVGDHQRRGVHRLDADALCKIFSLLDHNGLARCSAVCKSWHRIIQESSLWKDLCYKHYNKVKDGNSEGLSSCRGLPNMYFAELAMEQHRRSLTNGKFCVHQWDCHSNAINQCRMKMGMILTGVGDKVLRMWSSRSYRCIGEYSVPGVAELVDFDFDESKIVGLVGNQIYIWRRHGKQSILVSSKGQFSRGYCMRYMDPEAVIGCGDGTVRVYDMYSRACSQIIRMHAGPITCLSLSDHQFIISGSSLGSITVADLSSEQNVASLKTSTSPTGISSLCFNQGSYYVFAGSTSGFAHCWDLRTLKPFWETRASPNVLYSMHHLLNDTSSLAVGGIDGVLRIMDPNTGDVLSSYVPGGVINRSTFSSGLVQRNVRSLSQDSRIDVIPKKFRPPITSLAVGMEKVITAHNDKYIMMWKFHS